MGGMVLWGQGKEDPEYLTATPTTSTDMVPGDWNHPLFRKVSSVEQGVWGRRDGRKMGICMKDECVYEQTIWEGKERV